ncbi:SAM-dependent methyltransferase, partial [bacterium AH-315-C08]|nr:SAM-dependent methyltransferase [bacterium AH-315-C08]
MKTSTCRFCNANLISFCDLGLSPLANSFLEEHQLQTDETFYPLHAYICEACHLVQL